MNTTPATSLADFSSGIGTAGATLQIDNDTDRIGIGTNNPQGTLQVGSAITMGGNTGIITAVTYNADSNVNVGSAITIVGATGVISATTYYGENINAGAAVTIVGASGIVSATSFYGDGSGLTGISAGSFASNDTGITVSYTHLRAHET